MKHALAVLILLGASASSGIADDCPPCPAPPPAPAPPSWTMSLGAGLTRTGGNSDTSSYNAVANAAWDPPGRHAVRGEILYLRASDGGAATVDRTLAALRDEYTMSGRAFAFGEIGYQSDRFKELDHLITPLIGLGYKVVDAPTLLLDVDGGAGAAFEKLEGREATSDFAIKAGQRAEWKASATATVFQKAAALWKARDFGDAYYRFEAGIAAALSRRLELKVAFADDYKTRPARPELVKNDTSLVVSLLFKP
jgi:putative salt-induced outer membrane protein